MRATWWVMAAFSITCVACSRTTWQEPGEIRPSTYQASEERITRSVGKLRRLALAPIRYEAVQGGDHLLDEELRLRREWSSTALTDLSDWKGYDVVPLELREDISLKQLGQSPDEIHRWLEILANWAKDSPDGGPPPEEVVTIVRNIGRAVNTDGVVIVQGFRRVPSIWNKALTILSASLTWPLLMVEARFEIRADVYEIKTGRIVWRHRILQKPPHIDDVGPPPSAMHMLFEPLEQALPSALIDR